MVELRLDCFYGWAPLNFALLSWRVMIGGSCSEIILRRHQWGGSELGSASNIPKPTTRNNFLQECWFLSSLVVAAAKVFATIFAVTRVDEFRRRTLLFLWLSSFQECSDASAARSACTHFVLPQEWALPSRCASAGTSWASFPRPGFW